MVASVGRCFLGMRHLQVGRKGRKEGQLYELAPLGSAGDELGERLPGLNTEKAVLEGEGFRYAIEFRGEICFLYHPGA